MRISGVGIRAQAKPILRTGQVFTLQTAAAVALAIFGYAHVSARAESDLDAWTRINPVCKNQASEACCESYRSFVAAHRDSRLKPIAKRRLARCLVNEQRTRGIQEVPQGHVLDIDFRRGPSGEGRVLITLLDPNTRIEVTEKGKHVCCGASM